MQTNGLRDTATAERPNGVGQLDLYRLLVFYTLVNEGTMSKASERLYISQPAISAHMKALESGLGVSLFDRVGRRSVVNSAGEVLYGKSELLFAAADELRTAMEDLRGAEVGRLVLGASVVWQYHLPRLLDLFKQKHPHVEVLTQVGNSDLIERMVQDRSVDIGFIGREPVRPDLDSEVLALDEVVAVWSSAHPMAAGQPDSEVLGGEGFVVRETGSAVRQVADILLANFAAPATVSMELGSQEAIEQVVMAGRGVGIVSKAGVEPRLQAGLLAMPDLVELNSPLRLYVIRHKNKRLTATQDSFLEMARANGTLSS